MRSTRNLSLAALAALGACELQEVTVVDVEDVVVAEVLLQVAEEAGAFNGSHFTAFLHRTVGGSATDEVPGATVTVTRSDGLSVEFGETALERCVATTPEGLGGTCYWTPPTVAQSFAPGDSLELTITLASGGVLRSASVVPGDFSLRRIEEGGLCRQPADQPLTISWGRSEGAWAYINETLLFGLKEALATRGIGVAEEEPLYLLGLSVAASDTSIVFPGEFGVFNRFELERDIATALQEGLPAEMDATVMITAADRNYVNWVRGGSFNPSGQVRVPSVRGDGTGVFGTTVIRTFRVTTKSDGEPGTADCPSG